MTSTKGFSLLSFLLYLTLFSIITFFICQAITSLVIPSLISLRKNQSLVALHIASDFFVRDIKTIANEPDAWQIILPHELIWRKKQVDENANAIGWRFIDNRLERREGLYEGNWKKVKTRIIAKGLTKVIFSPEKDANHIIAIELSMTSSLAAQKPVICYVCTKNGVGGHETE